MQCAVCPYRTVHQLSFGDDQFLLLWRKEELRYHPKRAEQIDEAQPIDDFLSLPCLLYTSDAADDAPRV